MNLLLDSKIFFSLIEGFVNLIIPCDLPLPLILYNVFRGTEAAGEAEIETMGFCLQLPLSFAFACDEVIKGECCGGGKLMKQQLPHSDRLSGEIPIRTNGSTISHFTRRVVKQPLRGRKTAATGMEYRKYRMSCEQIHRWHLELKAKFLLKGVSFVMIPEYKQAKSIALQSRMSE